MASNFCEAQSTGTTFGAADVQELIGLLDAGEYALPARSQLTVGRVWRILPATSSNSLRSLVS